MKSKNRIGSLDFIKFLASALIVFHHFQGDFGYENRFITFSGGSIYYGYVVEMFFIISGILVGLKNNKNSKMPFGMFMKNKMMRLFPMTTYSTLVYMGLVVLFKIFFDMWYCSEPLSPIAILRGLSLIYCGGALVYQNVEPNCILWYICVLIICYVIYRIILALQTRMKIKARYLFIFMIFLGIGIISFSINLPFLNMYSARGYLSFFFGVELVDLYSSVKNKKKLSLISGLIIAAFIIYGLIDIETLFGTGLDQEMTLTFILYPAIIGFLTVGGISFLFNNGFFRFLGAISFEIYLCHYHVFMVIHLLEHFKLIEYPRSDMGMLLVLSITIVLSICVYCFIEKPLARHINKKYLSSKKKLGASTAQTSLD